MGDKTGISWTDATWNPVRGCSRVSEGCRNCYAERVAARFSDERQPYHGLADRSRKGSKWTGVVRLIPEHLADPLRWKRTRRIFVNSMSDLFHEGLSNEEIAAVFGVMAASPQHTFQVLTKRAKRMREWFAWVTENRGRTPYVAHEVSGCLLEAEKHVGPLGADCKWPLPNVWIGVSVENQSAADERIPELLETPAAVRFLSCEPLIGPVDLKGWGDHAPPVAEDAPETWAEFAWPEWVPEEQRRQIESFWSASNGRGPRHWVRDHKIQHVPATGARVTCGVSKSGWANVNKMATLGVTGRYLHSWNNIGRIITDDGQTVYASGGIGSGWLSRWLCDDGEYRSKLHWVIAGCESGHGARSCEADWLRSLRDQCAPAGVAFFLKQAAPREGQATITDLRPIPQVLGRIGELIPVVGIGAGSKEKGRGIIELPYLDGIQHVAFPEVRP